MATSTTARSPLAIAAWAALALAVALILLTPFFTGVLRGYAQTLFEMIIQVGSRP